MALRYNEETKEFEEVEVKFTIGGKEWSDERLMVAIPVHYRDLFENHDFPNMEIFRRALMYASCANEARYYNRPWITQRDEISLRKCLEL